MCVAEGRWLAYMSPAPHFETTPDSATSWAEDSKGTPPEDLAPKRSGQTIC
nr:hypothetical protein [uncultured bacterium]